MTDKELFILCEKLLANYISDLPCNGGEDTEDMQEFYWDGMARLQAMIKNEAMKE